MSKSQHDLNTAPAVMSSAVLETLASLNVTLTKEQQEVLDDRISSTAASTRATEASASTLAKVLKPPQPKPHTGKIDAMEAHNFIDSNEEYNSIVLLHRDLWTSYAVLRLEGDARAWWRATGLDPKNTPWEDFRRAFITAHSPPGTVMRARTALHHLQQQGRPVAAYTHEFHSHLRLAEDVDTHTTIHYYVSGLDEKIRLQVRLADPQTLEEAIVKATKVDDILREDKGKTVAGPSSVRATADPMAMDIDNISVGRITAAERERLRRNN
ncbi:hypothetical protein BGZ73_001806, partial [Actinomortierella ambigua]